MTADQPVLLAGARTPMGRLQGALAACSATDLGAVAIAGAIERAGLTPGDVEFAYVGNVVAAGTGQVPARRATHDAGIPLTVPSTLLNRACLSGMHAIHLATQMLRLGEAEVVVAGGMESMTNAPHLLTKARAGYRIGDGTLVDSMMADGLTCTIEQCAMGEATERFAVELELGRERQDAFAAQSHQRAATAQKDGLLAEEIVPVTIPQRRGEPVVVDDDEGIRPDADAGSMARLPRSCLTARSPVPTPASCTSPATPSPGRWTPPASRSATSTCWRSTRHSPPWRWPRWTPSASMTTS
jgi:acetyl-CoA C-acetyltransferase